MKGALDSQPQVIKFTSCLPMVGCSLRVLRLLPPLKLVAEILLKVAIKHQKSNQINSCSKIVQSEHCVCWIMIGCFVRAGTWNLYSSVLSRMACYHYHCLCWIMIGCFIRAGTHILYSGVLSRMTCYHYHFLWSLYCAHSFLICLFVVFVVFSYLYWSLIVFFLNVNFATIPSIFYFSFI